MPLYESHKPPHLIPTTPLGLTPPSYLPLVCQCPVHPVLANSPCAHARRGLQYQVTDTADTQMDMPRRGGAALFTLPPKCTVVRRPEQRPRLPCLWICVAHQHRQCASGAAVGRGVRHCCARGHAGHPRVLATLPRLRGRVHQAATRTPGSGGTPSAKRHRKQRMQPPEGVRERPHKQGRVDPAPPPPQSQESTHAAAGHHTAWVSRDGGDIIPTPQRF